MKNILLGIIAINLTFLSIITSLNYVQTAQAASGIQKVAICDISGEFIGECADLWSSTRYGKQLDYRLLVTD